MYNGDLLNSDRSAVRLLSMLGNLNHLPKSLYENVLGRSQIFEYGSPFLCKFRSPEFLSV
ncbi:hypothetical protein M413DRAFT_446042 [Hebeloma cylindrosporum]|uniref:Uncharacterized protein n=1 Tax=Hebeloma cylindrosporum TaxID=76867 RepID=A0A0C2YHV1_HEBCY|nr:hypothetical protein M413DRAFT_446042 [Hebeloma cylindrosporum h7]